MHTLYIYYKVIPSGASGLHRALHRLQQHLRERMPGLVCQLQRRTDLGDDAHAPQTWMESYRFNGFADERAWDALRTALDEGIRGLPDSCTGEAGMGPRHEERFVMLAAPTQEP